MNVVVFLNLFLVKGVINMKLTAPSKGIFWISFVLAIIAIVSIIITIPFLSGIAVWILLVAFVLLFLGNMIKGL